MLWFVLGQITLKSLFAFACFFHMWYFTKIGDICQSILHYRKTTIFILSFLRNSSLVFFADPLYYLTFKIIGNVNIQKQHIFF